MFRPPMFDLAHLLVQLKAYASSINETVENIVLIGNRTAEEEFRALLYFLQCSSDLGFSETLSLQVDGDPVGAGDLTQYVEEGYQPYEWKLNLNKLAAMRSSQRSEADCSIIFFIDSQSFYDWVNGLDPLRTRNNLPIQCSPLAILSTSVKSAFGGPSLAVMPIDATELPTDWPMPELLPEEKAIQEHVHVVPDVPMRLRPSAYSLTWGDLTSENAKPFRKASASTLAACLVDVLHSPEWAEIKGIRHVQLPLLGCDDDVSPSILEALSRAVKWCYEERPDTRKRLLADRLSLDASSAASIVSILKSDLYDALSQAQDQYRFVILDRKDEYARERRELLKDLREQADLYASKTRLLISCLLRDALAAFVFVALALTTKVGLDPKGVSPELVSYFFSALAGYFVVAALLQSSSAWWDVKLADKELKSWSNITRDYLSAEEVNRYIDIELWSRRLNFWIFLGIVVAIYMALAYGALQVPTFMDI